MWLSLWLSLSLFLSLALSLSLSLVAPRLTRTHDVVHTTHARTRAHSQVLLDVVRAARSLQQRARKLVPREAHRIVVSAPASSRAVGALVGEHRVAVAQLVGVPTIELSVDDLGAADGESEGEERALVETVHGARAMLSLVDANGASLVDRSSAAGELERLGTKLAKQQQKAAQLADRVADPVYCARAPAAAQEGERVRLDEMHRSIAGAEQSMHDLEAALAS